MTENKREIYAKSQLTDAYYRVTRWVHVEGDKIKAREKEEVKRKNVPNEWLEKLDGWKDD